MNLNLFKNSKNTVKDTSNLSLVIKTNRCPQNHVCPSVRVCPVGALTQLGHKAPLVDENKCIKCGKCSKFCPMGALVLE